MAKLLQTKTVSYLDLCSKGLINDLKEAATCEVRTVCRISCNHCPYILENIDTQKITVKRLGIYTIALEKAENEPLLISITSTNISSWLHKNKLPVIPPQRDKRPDRNRFSLLNHREKATQKVS